MLMFSTGEHEKLWLPPRELCLLYKCVLSPTQKVWIVIVTLPVFCQQPDMLYTRGRGLLPPEVKRVYLPKCRPFLFTVTQLHVVGAAGWTINQSCFWFFCIFFFIYSYLINNDLRLVGGTWPCVDIDIKQRFTPHHHVSWTCLRVVSASACARRGTTDAGHPSCWEAFQHD